MNLLIWQEIHVIYQKLVTQNLRSELIIHPQPLEITLEKNMKTCPKCHSEDVSDEHPPEGETFWELRCYDCGHSWEERNDGEMLECQLFSWNGWDGDMECMTFYRPILKIQIGKYPIGTMFDVAHMLYEKSVVQFLNHGTEPIEFKLVLSIGR